MTTRTPDGKTFEELDRAEDAARAAADLRPACAWYDGDEEEDEEEEEAHDAAMRPVRSEEVPS